MFSFLNYKPPEKKEDFQIKTLIPSQKNTFSKNCKLKESLNDNVNILKELLHFPKSNDLIFRFFDIKINNKKYNAMIAMYDGLCDSYLVSDFIIRQLMVDIKTDNNNHSIIKKKIINNEIKNTLVGNHLSENQISFVDNYAEVINRILHGDCALIIDTLNQAIISDVKKIPSRSITKSENEMTLKGPSENFIENFRTNTSLIRKFVKDENLIFETIEVGNQSKTRCAIAYITNITNTSLINEVKKRVKGISIDYLLDSGQLEQLIEDHTFIVEPLILSTERPDKVASSLTEGRVAIIVENSPNVLIVPAIYTDFLRSSEDSYVRYPYTLLLRLFRIPAIILSVLLPRFIYSNYNLSSRNDSNRFIIFNCRYKRKSTFFNVSRTFNYGSCI